MRNASMQAHQTLQLLMLLCSKAREELSELAEAGTLLQATAMQCLTT
jgi:hypothetical protein